MRINALYYQKQAAKEKQKEEFIVFAARKQEWFKGFTSQREKALGFKENEVRTAKY
ncbi:MAG: hypothetical protein KDK61_08675 [Simkania sp.]|nr:hypothetical protein [Simkania sp.]